jgi:uncharacterized protein (TIGR02444 family)
LTAWDFAVAAWRLPGVEAIGLKLQNEHGQCPSLLLWRAWAAGEGRGVTPAILEAAVSMAREWGAGVILLLRAVRGELKEGDGQMPASARLAVRKAVLAAELEAERALIEALEAMTPAPADKAADPLPALVEMARLWRAPEPTALLAELAQALRLRP